MLRVLVCSKSQSVGRSIGDYLRHSVEIEVVDVLVDLDEVLSRLESSDFDVCIVSLSSYAWFDHMAQCLQVLEGEKKKFVIGVLRISSESILLALRYGANAVLEFGLHSQTLVHNLRQVVAGRIDMAKDNSVADVHQLCPENSVLHQCRDSLDFFILSQLIEGISNEEIATRCNVAIQTVRNRLVRLMREGLANNRTHLVTLLLRN